MNRVGRLEEIPPESREVFANGISVCLAGQQLWITTKRAARAPISASATSRGPALAGGRSHQWPHPVRSPADAIRTICGQATRSTSGG